MVLHNYPNQKKLSSCTSDELDSGTCFELSVSDVPVRRGVVIRTYPVPMAWFKNKSSSPEEVFPLDADFSSLERSTLTIQGIANDKYHEFVKRLPSIVRARGGGTNTRARGNNGRGGNAHGATTESGREDETHGDDYQHPHLVRVKTTKDPPSSKRLKDGGPGCSPPDSPVERKPPERTKKPTPTEALHTAICDLTKSVSNLAHQVKKLRKTPHHTSS